MTKGLNLSFVSDVRDFLRGTSKIEDALDDVSGSLDDLAKDAQKSAAKAGDAIASNVEDGTRDATTAADKMERSFKDTFDTVSSASKKSGDDVGDHMKRGTDDATHASAQFKDEAKQNFAETASSFDGSMQGAVDGVQGTLGGLAGSLGGPMGLAAGVLAGLGGAMYTSFTANAEKVEERVKAMYDDLVQSGLDYLTSEGVMSSVKALYDDKGELDRVTKAAKTLGVSVESVAAAYVQSGAQRDAVNSDAQAAIAREDEAIGNLRDQAASASEAQMRELGTQIQAHETAKAGYQGVLDMMGEQEKSFDAAKSKRDSFAMAEAVALDQVRENAAGSAQAIDAVGSSADAARAKFDGLGRPITTSVTLDTSQAEQRMAAFRENLAKNNVVITAELRQSSGYYANRASGGLVAGEGSDIEDRVNLHASPGEYVLDAQATQQIGVGRLDQLNNGQHPPTRRTPASGPAVVVNVTADSAMAAEFGYDVAKKTARRLQDVIATYGIGSITG